MGSNIFGGNGATTPLSHSERPQIGNPSTARRRSWRLPVLIAAIAGICAFLPQFVLAQAPPAHTFFGHVTVNRLPPKDGTVLTAFVGGRQAGQVEVVGGKYEISIKRSADRPLAGQPVRFKIVAVEIDAATRWFAGETTRLDIKVVRALQTPVPIQRRQIDIAPKIVQDTGEVQDIQRRIQALNEDRAKAKSGLEEQVNSQIAALDQSIEQKREELRETAGEELDTVVQKVENAINRPRPNPLSTQQIRRLESEVEETETDLRTEFNRKMALLEEERSQREQELILLANAELDDLDRQIREMELELERRIAEKDAPRVLRETDQATSAEPPTDTEPPAAAASDSSASTSDDESGPTAAERKASDKGGRGFFFNSVSGELSGFDESLDPTTIAVLGILITLIATTLQLVKGN